MIKFYIAGPISGIDYETAVDNFERAESVLEQMGHEPVNPMRENGLDGDGKEHPWAEYMRRDIPHLLKCDGIYLLPGWSVSKGACLERHIAFELGMLIVEAI